VYGDPEEIRELPWGLEPFPGLLTEPRAIFSSFVEKEWLAGDWGVDNVYSTIKPVPSTYGNAEHPSDQAKRDSYRGRSR